MSDRPAVPRKVRCPMCAGQSIYAPSNPFRPFCSERCKLMDLGAWASDQYSIPGAPLEQPLDPDPDQPALSSVRKTLQ